MKRKFLILICFVFIVSMAAVSATDDLNQTDDDTLSVSLNDNEIIQAKDGGTFTDLQKKIDAAPEGSTINLENNYIFVESVDYYNPEDDFQDDWDDDFPEDFPDDFPDDFSEDEFHGNPVKIYKPLTINGNGFTIDGNYLTQIFSIECEGKVVLNNINFINAFGDGCGGSIGAYCDLTVNSCNFKSSSTKILAGGAIYVQGNLEVYNSNFVDNMVGNIDEPFGAAGDFGGGAIFVNGRLTARGCDFINNHAKVGDYAVYVEGDSSFTDCSFQGNDNGAIYFEGNSILNGCRFEDNSAGMFSIVGGEYESTLSVSGSSFVNNSVYDHGGIVSVDGALSINDCSFTNNSGGEYGAIIVSPNTDISNTIFVNNYPEAVYPEGTRTKNVTVIKPSHINIERSVFVPGEDIQINITLDERATGELIVEINGETEKLTLTDSSASLTMQNYGIGTYDLSIKYLGDDSFAPSVKSTTLKVVESTFRDLQSLICQLHEGDTLELDRNYTYAESLDRNSPIMIEDNIRIKGNGYTLDGNGKTVILSIFYSKAILEDINFENGVDAISCYEADLTVNRCNFTNNCGGIGGDGKLTVTDSRFMRNMGNTINFNGDSTVSGCTFAQNVPDGSILVGVIEINGNLNIKDCIFENNTVGSFISTGLLNVGGNLSLSNCSFVNNGGSSALSGCIVCSGNSFIGGSRFVNNSAEYGGAMEIGGSSTVSDCVFENNSAECGGAIRSYLAENLIVRNCIFINNHAKPKYDGDAIDSLCHLELSDCTFIRHSEDKNERTYREVSKSVLKDKNVVVCEEDYSVLRCTLIEKGAAVNIYAPDVTKYYGGSERFVVTLKNDYGNPVADADVKIRINGVDYTRTTNSNGIASMALGLPSNIYEVTTTYGDVIVKSKVTIKDTVFADDFTKMHKNQTQYSGTFIDTLGRTLPANSPVEININGVFYTRYTDDRGVARMNINLNPGTYILTAKNPATGEMQATKITVIGTIVENHDLTKYYRNASQYSLRLLDGKGNPVKAGVDIRLNINGVFYTRTSNDDGYVKMNINLEPGEYIITADYNGLMASNRIKVLSVIESHDLTMSYKDGSKFEVRILDGQGRPYAAQNVTFNINGVFYDKITDDEGFARLAINLMAGEYIITSSYNGMNAANKVTISS